jgi:hypothetical protein
MAGGGIGASVPEADVLRSMREFAYIMSSGAKRRYRVYMVAWSLSGIFTRIPNYEYMQDICMYGRKSGLLAHLRGMCESSCLCNGGRGMSDSGRVS